MIKKKISVVSPVYNESLGLTHFHSEISKIIDSLKSYSVKIYFIDDGSTDDSLIKLKNIASVDSRVEVVSLARNFGKEIATTAGIHIAEGDAIIIIDSDSQHPVELIPEFIKRWEQGSDVVIGVRTENQKEGLLKKIGSSLFYSLLNKIGVKNIIKGSTDFRIIDRSVVMEFNKLTEHSRITRALIDWLGYSRSTIEFKANPRIHGQATYSTKKLFQLAFDSFISLSFTPLYFVGYIGVIIMLLSSLLAILMLIEKYILSDFLSLNISGTAILALLIIFLVGIILSCQGILSLYIARIYTEVQNRPLYIIKKSSRK